MHFFVTTSDVGAGKAFIRIADELCATVEFCEDAKSSLAALEEQRFDMVVIDCDDVYRGDWLLRSVRTTRANKSSLLVALTNGATQQFDALDQGANVVIAKPLVFDNIRSKLRNTCESLANGQRRERRHAVHLPVFLSYGQVFDRRAEVFNLSVGGMGVRVSEPLCDDEIVHLRFSLPGYPRCIQARGEIAWADRDGNMGFKFIGIGQECATALTQWLQRKLLV
jgi:CheY-like chemotaxis protein